MARLTVVAANAFRNGDLFRAIEILDGIADAEHGTTGSAAGRGTGSARPVPSQQT